MKKDIKSKKENIKLLMLIVITILLTLVTHAYLIILNGYNIANDGNILKFILKNINITKFAITFLTYLGINLLLYRNSEKVGEFLYKFRFAIAGLVFVLCVAFEISGSSIGMWRYCVGSDMPSTGDIVGKARSIRGDEWVVYTPFAISQENNKPESYQYISNTIRGDKTDVFIVYGQPVKDISMVFRPFQIGYLLFGSAKGLSFFWCGRFIALFLVSFELGMIITKKRKDISLILALLTILSPAVEWWFSVNGFVEMIVFGGLAVILLQKYMMTNKFFKRLFYLAIMAICAGGYILVFYPAWQVPMAYIFAGLAIWVIIKNRKNCKIKFRDILSIIAIICILGVMLLNIVTKSMDTIKLVMNTAYPGARCETGGDMGTKYFQYPSNLFFSLDEQDLGTNVCEAAVFFDLFPIGLIFVAIVIFKEKNRDSLLIILLIISGIFGIWCTVGFPKILAKLTVLYVSPAQRTFVAVGFLNILMLIRAMSLMKTKFSKKSAILISTVLMIVVFTSCFKSFPEYYGTLKIAITMFTLSVLYFLLFRYDTEKGRKAFIYMLTITLLFMSFLINPIRKGIDVIENQPVGEEIKSLNEEDTGLWIVEEVGYPIMNFPIMYGAATINSTNVYPNLERWQKLDKKGEYQDVYNRYAHITIELTEDEEAKFELLYPDSFKVILPVNKLQELNVKYILTPNDISGFENENVKFEEQYSNYGLKIYKVSYENVLAD